MLRENKGDMELHDIRVSCNDNDRQHMGLPDAIN